MYIAIILTKNVPWKSLTKIISSSSRSDYSITSSQRFHFSQLHQTFTSLSTDFVIIWHPSFADEARSTHTNKRSNNYWRLLRQGSVCVCVPPSPRHIHTLHLFRHYSTNTLLFLVSASSTSTSHRSWWKWMVAQLTQHKRILFYIGEELRASYATQTHSHTSPPLPPTQTPVPWRQLPWLPWCSALIGATNYDIMV